MTLGVIGPFTAERARKCISPLGSVAGEPSAAPRTDHLRSKKSRELRKTFWCELGKERRARAHVEVEVFLRPPNPANDHARRTKGNMDRRPEKPLHLCLPAAALDEGKSEIFFDGGLAGARARSNSQPTTPRETRRRRQDIAEAFAKGDVAARKACVGPSKLSNKGGRFPRMGGEMASVGHDQWETTGCNFSKW